MSFQSERGTTLLETVIATGILVIALAGIMSLVSVSGRVTENQGHLAARTTEYALDKMEQLLALKYGDIQSDTRVFPATTAGGSGLAIGGSSNPAAPVALYVDYLDQSGSLLPSVGTTAPTGWFYKRAWQVADACGGCGTLKQITVTSIVARSPGVTNVPQSTVTAIKTSPF